MPPLVLLVLAVFLLNVPFGFWRGGVRKFSPAWFVAVHAPIPVVVALRFALGIGYKPASIPLVLVAYFAGQFAGGRLRKLRDARRVARAGEGNEGA